MARSEDFAAGRGAEPVQPRIAKDERGRGMYVHPVTGASLPSNTNADEWNGVAVPQSRAVTTSNVDTSVRTTAAPRSVVEQGITERTPEEMAMRPVAGAKREKVTTTISPSVLKEHMAATGRDFMAPRELITQANEAAQTLRSHIGELEASHGSHPVVGPMIASAKDSWIKGAKALADAHVKSFGREGITRASQAEGRPLVAEGLAHLIDAHEILAHPLIKSSGAKVSTGVLGETLGTLHSVAVAQSSGGPRAFKSVGKPRNKQGLAGDVYDASNPEDKADMDAAKAGRRAKAPGFDQSMGFGNTGGVKRFRKADRREMDSREAFTGKYGTSPATAEDIASTRPVDPKKSSTASQSRISVDRANLTEGGATVPVVPLSEAGPGRLRASLPEATATQLEQAATRRRTAGPKPVPTKVIAEPITKKRYTGPLSGVAPDQGPAPKITPGPIPAGTVQGATATARASGSPVTPVQAPAGDSRSRTTGGRVPSAKAAAALARIAKKSRGGR